MGRYPQQIAAFSLAFLSAAILLCGCGSAKETEKSKAPSSSAEVKQYEEFRPSDYDLDIKTFFAGLRKSNGNLLNEPGPPVTEQPLTAQGYRVQIFASGEIDEANAKKAEAEAALPGEWIYVEYEPPTYKVRAGNFVNRPDADAFVKLLSDKGYTDAWVVPDKITKNLPPRPLPPPPTPPQDQQPPR